MTTKKGAQKDHTVEPIAEKKGNVIVIDTNVLINDPDSVFEFIKGDNILVIPRAVVIELDKLKSRAEVGFEARLSIRNIQKIKKEKKDKLFVCWKHNFSGLGLDKTIPDHQILASFNHILSDKQFFGYKKFKLVSDDAILLIIAEGIFNKREKVELAPYKHIRVKVRMPPKALKTVTFKEEDSRGKGVFSSKRFKGLKENSGMLCKIDDGPLFMSIKKGDVLVPVKEDVSVCGLKPMSDEQVVNWQQVQFIHQLLDPSISVVFASGKAGTGKTLLALAAGLQQRNRYKKIIITRPAIPLEGEDNLGFLPGDLNAKMFPYIVPFIQDLEVIIDENPKGIASLISDKSINKELMSQELNKDSFSFLKKLGVTVDAIQHYKGRTYHNAYIIIDEAQNLKPGEMKTIITRAGKNCKIVLTGSLEQVDRKFLNEENSGLAYAMVKMENQPIVGISVLVRKVRSPLSALAEKLL